MTGSTTEPLPNDDHESSAPLPDLHTGDARAKTEIQGQVEVIFGTIRTVVIGFSLLFAVVVGGLGFLGWRTMADMGVAIDGIVDRRVGALVDGTTTQNASLSATIFELTTQVNSATTRVGRLLGDLDNAEQALRIVNAGQTDPVGDYLRILNESSIDYLDVEQRRRAETVFRRLIEQSQSEAESVPAEVLFNAAATASEFDMTALGARLATAAHETNPNSVNEARMLRFELRTNQIGAAEAYEHMRRLSESAPRHQIHLTLSELFNLAAVSGRFEEFADMLDDLKERLGPEAMSYIWLLKAQTVLVNGGSDAIARGLAEIRQGLELLQGESPGAVWYESAVEEASEWLQRLMGHPEYSDTVSELRDEYAFLLEAPLLDGSTIEEIIGELRIELYWRGVTRIPNDALALGVGASTTISADPQEDLWFYFEPSQSQVYTFEAEGSSPSFDPVIALYSVTGDGLDFLQFNDDQGTSLAAGLSVALEQGVGYYVGVSDYYARQGSVTVSVE